MKLDSPRELIVAPHPLHCPWHHDRRAREVDHLWQLLQLVVLLTSRQKQEKCESRKQNKLRPHASQQQPSALVVQLRRAAGLPAAARRLGVPRTDTRLAADTARPGEAALAAEAPTCTDRGPNA